MSTKPSEPAARPVHAALDRYLPGDPIPVPEAIEANSESAWALFSDSPAPPEPDFLDTVPASLLDEAAIAAAPQNTA